MKKIFLIILLVLLISGFVGFETYYLTIYEISRENTLATSTFDGINTDLDLIKVAIMTTDADSYEKSITSAKEKLSALDSLLLSKNHYEAYRTEISSFLDSLSPLSSLISETRALNIEVKSIEDHLRAHYTDTAALSREVIRAASDDILSKKLPVDAYSFDSLKKSVESINSTLDTLAEKSRSLSDCIDTCYEDDIVNINNSLSDSLKSFLDSTHDLNSSVEKEYSLDIIQKIKDSRPEGYTICALFSQK